MGFWSDHLIQILPLTVGLKLVSGTERVRGIIESAGINITLDSDLTVLSYIDSVNQWAQGGFCICRSLRKACSISLLKLSKSTPVGAEAKFHVSISVLTFLILSSSDWILGMNRSFKLGLCIKTSVAFSIRCSNSWSCCADGRDRHSVAKRIKTKFPQSSIEPTVCCWRRELNPATQRSRPVNLT